MLNLTNAKVIGFFSLPSASLAEHNPDAYNNAMAGMPKGAGTCAHCGTCIVHHVMIQCEDGTVRHVGTTCVEKVGDEHVKGCVRTKLTSEQLERREAARAVKQAEFDRKNEELKAAYALRIKTNTEKFGPVLEFLLKTRAPNKGETAENTNLFVNQFLGDLGKQLQFSGTLSPRQAACVLKAYFPTGRRNKQNAVEWDTLEESLTGEGYLAPVNA